MSKDNTMSVRDASRLIVNSVKSIRIPSKIVINKNSKVFIKRLYREDVICETSEGGLHSGPPHSKLTITNKFNTFKNSSRTVAKVTAVDGSLISELNSDRITRVIGQKNYDTLFSALCSVINQDLKVRGVMALLMEDNTEDRSCQTEISIKTSAMVDTSCQTDENCMDIIFKLKSRKRLKRSVLTPYVIKDVPAKVKKVTVDPKLGVKQVEEGPKIIKTESVLENKSAGSMTMEPLPLLHLNEDSNLSTFSMRSNISDELLLQDPKQFLLKTIGEHTEKPVLTNGGTQIQSPRSDNSSNNATPAEKTIVNIDGTEIQLCVKPEDKFHFATPENLRSLSMEHREKLLKYQLSVDWNCCLEPDMDGNLPIHTAVLCNDLQLLRRQCLMLKFKQESVDITSDNMTPLQMSIFQDSPNCTEMLLRYGADPLVTDEEHRSCLHLAAEGATGHLRALVEHCRSRGRDVLQNNEYLWKPEYEKKSNEELGSILLSHVCKMFDSQGYTPLMLASKMGNYTNVIILLEAAPHTVNIPMPNSGNTALFLAVGEAYLDSTNRGNKSKVSEHFQKTLQFLMENGADATINNHSGINANSLQQEFGNAELSMLISKTYTALNSYALSTPSSSKDFQSVMLVKDSEGNINVSSITKKAKRKSKTTGNKTVTNDSNKATNSNTPNAKATDKQPTQKTGIVKTEPVSPKRKKPVILQNVSLAKHLIAKDIKTSGVKIISAKDLVTFKPNIKLTKSASDSPKVTINSVNVSNDLKSVTSGDKMVENSNKRKILIAEKEMLHKIRKA